MTQTQRFKIIAAHEWKEEEATVSLHILDHFKTCHLEGRNVYQKELYSVSIYAIENGYGFEWVQKDEAGAVLAWALKKFGKDRNYFQKKMREFRQVSAQIDEISAQFQQGLSHDTGKALATLFLQIFALGKKQYGYALLPEGLDILEQKDYQSLLPNVKAEDVPQVIAILSTPVEHSFLEREKLDLLTLAKIVFENSSLEKAIKKRSLTAIRKFSHFYQRMQVHQRKYFWIQNSFREALYLEEKYFLDQVADLINKMTEREIQKEIAKLQIKKEVTRKQRDKISQQYKLSKQTQFFFALIRLFTLQQDQRKENVQKLVYCIDQLWVEAAKRYRITKAELNNYFVSELAELLQRGKIVPPSIFNTRKKLVFFSYLQNDQIATDTLTGKEAAEIMNFFKKRKRKLVALRKIKGLVASRGNLANVITGRVRIVFDPGKDLFRRGEILVTGMTRPEFVPLMKKAKAIITNEGGITTHAAIISRELNLPCIIGTKIATKILKDGDVVEINLQKGIVQKVPPLTKGR